MRARLILGAFPVWLADQFTLLEEPRTTPPEQRFSLSMHGIDSRAACSQQTWKGNTFKALLVGCKQDAVFSYCPFHDVCYRVHWCEAEGQIKTEGPGEQRWIGDQFFRA